MIAELNCVALTAPLPEHGLTAGDVGAVVYVFNAGEKFLVEFTTFEGQTVAVAKVTASHLRPLAANEIHHTRALDSIAPAGAVR